MSCEHVFLNKLRERGFRLTPQREIVLSTLHDLEGMASAEEILDQVRAVSAAVDISTVYRTLDLLGEFNMVVATDLGEGHREYKLVGEEAPHLHLVCRNCGQVIGVDLELAGTFRRELQDAYGFQAALDQLNIPGLCADCCGENGA